VKSFILLLLLLSITNADVTLIKSKSCNFNKIDLNIISKLFMLKKTYFQDEKVIIIDSDNREVYTNFVKKYLGKTPRKMKVYWTIMLFTGRKIPPKKLSKESLIDFNDKGICHISYINIDDKIKNWDKLIGYKID